MLDIRWIADYPANKMLCRRGGKIRDRQTNEQEDTMKRSTLLLLASLMVTGALMGADWITIYNDDLSMVRSTFNLELQEGRQEYNYSDITSRIEPASVIVTSENGQVRVAEQNYEYDLAGKAQIMAKYIDKEVTVLTKNQASLYRGIMKFYDGSSFGIIESGTNKLMILSEAEVEVIQLAELPSNFYTKPTLHWSLIAPKADKYPTMMTYLTGGFSWNVAYNAVWDEKTLALNSWVTIQNYSGKAFNDVTLKLIAGEVNKVRDYYYGETESMAGAGMMMDKVSAAPSFEEKAFHDFHMYTLDQKVSFADKQTKQLELYPLQNVNAKAVYEYQTYGTGISSLIRFKNTEANGLGKPLPKGNFKIYKKDTDGNLEFIGEDRIDHTSKNEEITLTTGKAFDLVGSTIVKESRTISNRVSERTIQVTLRNNSALKKTINVIHYLNSNTRILSASAKYDLDENLKATFPIQIDPDKEVVFTINERTEY